MKRHIWRVPLLGLATAGTLLWGVQQPVAAAPAGTCHQWAPVFKPVLAVLSVGKIEVALPAQLPRFRTQVYAHANVLQPPLTYDVALSTRPGHAWPVSASSTLLRVHGAAGGAGMHAGSTVYHAGGKTLDVNPPLGGMRSAFWVANNGIAYTVELASRYPVATLLKVAGSMVAAPLHKAPITNRQTDFNACP